MRFIKIILTFSVLLLTSNAIISQSKLVEKGNKFFERYAYDNSIKTYLKAIENDEKSSEIYANLADSYYHNADMENAALWYKQLMDFDLPKVKGEYYFRYSQALKTLGEYSKADLWLERLADLNADDSRAMSLKYDPDYLEKIEALSNRYSIKTVSINSSQSDFAAGFDNDRGVIFSSARDTGVARKITHRWTGLPFLQLYNARISDEGNLVEAVKLDGDFNKKYNESSVAITNDGGTMYFTRNSFNKGYQKDKTGIIRLKLYRAYKSGNYWTDITELPFNSTEYSTAHPALSQDNSKLYFASDMPGTNGLSDIYVVDLNSDGSFSEPINLGPQINTEGRDTFPFVSKNGDLYFASDGHLGLGGLDVFVCKDLKSPGKDNIFNIGKPINSTKDDFAFIIDDETANGYFTSNRDGGVGSDDIYKLIQIKPIEIPCEFELNGIVTNKKTGDFIPNASIVINNIASESIKELKSDANGEFSLVLDCNVESYIAIGTKESFTQDTESFTIDKEKSLVRINLELEPKTELIAVGRDLSKDLNINPIYFDFDKSFIRADARVELEKVIDYMNEYPSIKIDVRSHTDSRAPDDYNIALSQRRNKSTRAYLVKKGISPSRLSGRGYGETQLVNKCRNDVKCSKEQHQLNRRSEFIVIEN
ncbi:MAG: OmpA family protein [Flavobacteriaceae bacterium]|nr:OmpA family protein [Flavobacteriaceae bacterium]